MVPISVAAYGSVYSTEITPADFIQLRSSFKNMTGHVCYILDLTIHTVSRKHSQIKYVAHAASHV